MCQRNSSPHNILGPGNTKTEPAEHKNAFVSLVVRLLCWLRRGRWHHAPAAVPSSVGRERACEFYFVSALRPRTISAVVPLCPCPHDISRHRRFHIDRGGCCLVCFEPRVGSDYSTALEASTCRAVSPPSNAPECPTLEPLAFSPCVLRAFCCVCFVQRWGLASPSRDGDARSFPRLSLHPPFSFAFSLLENTQKSNQK